MNKAVNVFLALAALCLLGVFIALKIQQSAANKARTAKARETEAERRVKVRLEKENSTQQTDQMPDLFNSNDVANV